MLKKRSKKHLHALSKQMEDHLLAQLEKKNEEKLLMAFNAPGNVTDIQGYKLRWNGVDIVRYLHDLQSKILFLNTQQPRDNVGPEAERVFDGIFMQDVASILLLDLNLDETRALVHFLLDNADYMGASGNWMSTYIWNEVLDKLYIHTPTFHASDFEKEHLLSLISGKLNDPYDAISKSQYLLYLSLLCDIYVLRSIHKKNWDWNGSAMLQIVGLLDRNTAAYVLNKLSIRSRDVRSDDERKYYNYFIDQLRNSTESHTHFLVSAINRRFLTNLKENCFVVQELLKKYQIYMDTQKTKIPVHYIDYARQKATLKLRSLENSTQAFREMEQLRSHVQRMCE